MNKLIFLVILLNTTLAWSTPSDLHVGYMDGTTFVDPTTKLWGGELNPIFPNAVSIEINGGNSSGTISALDLFVGVESSITSSLPNINAILPTPSLNSTSYAINVAPTLVTTLSSSNTKISGASNSQNWSNWSGAYDALIKQMGPNDFFNVYEYVIIPSSLTSPDITAISNSLDNQDPISFGFTSGFSAGTFVFGEVISNKTFTTPFTETGFNQGTPPPLPEPGTIVMMSLGIVSLALYRRRKAK